MPHLNCTLPIRTNFGMTYIDYFRLFYLFFVSIIVGSIVFALCYFIHRKLYQTALVACFIMFVTSYVQGSFLVSNLPPLDGTVMDWKQYVSETVKSIFLWIIVILLVLV